jgi:hypothetical protein
MSWTGENSILASNDAPGTNFTGIPALDVQIVQTAFAVRELSPESPICELCPEHSGTFIPRGRNLCMKSRRWHWWRSRFAIYIGIAVVVFTVLIERKSPTQNLANPPTISSSPPISPTRLDWHDKRNWRTKLSVGMTETKVRAIFGEPEKVRVSNYRETWNYGTGEITFADGTVYNWSEPDSLK